MLVLSRKLGEKIWIGESICITVVDVDRGKIRLGIEAPRDVAVYRQELLPLNQQRPDGPTPLPGDRVMKAPGRADEPGVTPGQLPGCFPPPEHGGEA